MRLPVCLFGFLWAFLATYCALGQGAELTLAMSEAGGAYGEFAAAFRQNLEGSAWRIRWEGPIESLEDAAFRADLVVAVGSEAARLGLRKAEGRPLVATLLPRRAYERAIADFPRPRGATTAITLDQPLARLLALTRLLLPDLTRVGLLSGAESRGQLAPFRQAVQDANLQGDSEDVEGEDQLVPALNRLFGRVDALLALPDPTVYRRDNIRSILLTSYRHRKPVIGFSQAFAAAGGLAALYSSPAQIARQTAELIRPLGGASGGPSPRLSPPQAPLYFSIAVNRTVAQSLGLNLPDDGVLRRALGTDRDH